MSSEDVDLYILGAGVKIPAHLTVEVLEAIQSSNVLYTVIRKPKEEWLPTSVDIDVISYWDLFKAGDIRRNNYKRAVESILDAIEAKGPVAYLTPGNPVVFDSVSHALIEEGGKRGYKLKVCTGISSVDTLLTDVVQDIAPGLQIYDSSSLVLYDIPLNSCFPSILFQVDVFGSNRALHGIKTPRNYLLPLKEHLLRFYPENHEVTFVRSEMFTPAEKRLHKLTINSLDDIDSMEEMGTSLYIPSLEELQVANTAFLEKMNSRVG